MTDTVIVIPTYWTWGSDRPDGPDEAIFDHPTPVDSEGTLPRLLKSLCQVTEGPRRKVRRRPLFTVLVLTATVHPALAQAAERRVTDIIAPFREGFPIVQFTTGDLAVLQRHMRDLRYSKLVPLFSLRSYPGVRNCQLVVPHVWGAEVVIALDDDEVVAPDYLQTALHFVGREHGGEQMLGLAGPYLDANGNMLLPERPRTGNIFLDKSAIINEGIRTLQSAPGRLVGTPVAFGGNMVLHRDLFTRIGFDPGIARGEDIDYLINARLQGHNFWFDKELAITHLPPKAYQSSPYSKLCQDVVRFIYEREKLKQAGVDPAQFAPYPGRFLRDDLETHALAALQRTATPADAAQMGSPEEIVAEAQRRVREASPCYFTFAEKWPRLLDSLGSDGFLRHYWQAKFKG